MQFGDAVTEIAGAQVTRLPGGCAQQHRGDQHHHRGSLGLGQRTQARPQPVVLRFGGHGPPHRLRIEPRPRQQHRQQQHVGDQDECHTEPGGKRQLAHHVDFDAQDDEEADHGRGQRHRAREHQTAEGIVRTGQRPHPLHDFQPPGVRHLYRMADADGEDQERHQNGHRVDAEADQRQQPHQPNDRDHRACQREHCKLDGTRVQEQQHRGNAERNHEEHQHATRAVGDVTHRLGEADDVHIQPLARIALAQVLELLRHGKVIQPGTGVRVDLEQLRADHRRAVIVGHQAADATGLEHVLTHGLEIRRRALEVRRDDVATGKTGFDHLDETYVGRKQRGHGRPVHARDEEDLVGGRFQLLHETRVVDVALMLTQRDQHAVGTTEGVAVGHESLHVFVLERDHLLETRVDLQAARRRAEQHGQQHENAQEELAPLEQQQTKELDELLQHQDFSPTTAGKVMRTTPSSPTSRISPSPTSATAARTSRSGPCRRSKLCP